MSGGTGKYTIYAAVASAKNTLLNRLFKGNSTIPNPNQDLVGKETDARLQVVARGEQFLTPAHTDGDPGMFPNGVNLNFTGDSGGPNPPDLTKVAWTNAGDPANGYAPDISSPGPGRTDPAAKDTDPKLSVEDLKGAGYVPGGPDTGTKSPTQTTPTVVSNSELGTPGKLAYNVNG